MKDDLISRKAAIDALVDAYREKTEGFITTVRIMTLGGVMDVLSQLPSAQPTVAPSPCSFCVYSPPRPCTVCEECPAKGVTA